MGIVPSAARAPDAQPDIRPPGELGRWELLVEDFATYDGDLFEPGFWAVRLHRFGRGTAAIDSPVARTLCKGAYQFMFKLMDWNWGINLPATVDLGRRVRIWHQGCMFLEARSIGNDVHIRQSTSLGPLREGTTSRDALPVIEDGVDIGSGTCVMGAVRIGRQAVVGANSVVLEDVPPGANVLGVPARTVPAWSLSPRAVGVDGAPAKSGQRLPPGNSNENPAGMTLVELLKEDLRTHDSDLLSAGFWALAVHRIGNWRMGIRTKVVRAPFSGAYQLAYQAVIALWGIDIPYNAKIGRRLHLHHHGALFMGAREVGDDVQIQGPVTMGLRRRNDPSTPTIGSRVQIGANACIVGNLRVGDDSVIGPNTVLARDVAAGSTVVGIPGRRVNPSEYVPSAPPGRLCPDPFHREDAQGS
jgi:serine O-acetyltransferase